MSETTDDLEASSSFDDSGDRWDRLALDKVWVDGSNREWNIEDMTDTHLFNLLWMLKRIGLAKAWHITGNPEEDGAPFYPENFDPHWTEGFDEQEWEGIKMLLIEYALRRFDHACKGEDDSESLGLGKGRERGTYDPRGRQRDSSILDGAGIRARGNEVLDKLTGATGLRRKKRGGET
jgi:hypothetical protein